MTKPTKTIMVALMAIIMFSSCATFHEASDMGKEINLSAVSIGMSKTKVQNVLAKKPDNIVAAKNYPETNTTVEVVQYTQWVDANAGKYNAPVVPAVKQSYWLYFLNDKLDKWEIASLDHKPRI